MLSSHVNLLIFYAYSEEFTTFAKTHNTKWN